MGVWSWIRVLVLAMFSAAVVATIIVVYLDWRAPVHVTIGPGVPGEIVVAIDGGIATPGVVTLPAGSRLQDVVAAAGGFAADADTSGLNLAARVGDGERVTIPLRGPLSTALPPDSTPGAVTENLININTASVTELDQLPGIGPVIAQRIVEFRDAHGPFAEIDQLAEIEGISADMVNELRPLVTTGA
jgi:competence protein ComEA